jgi:hypothetical protein
MAGDGARCPERKIKAAARASPGGGCGKPQPERTPDDFASLLAHLRARWGSPYAMPRYRPECPGAFDAFTQRRVNASRFALSSWVRSGYFSIARFEHLSEASHFCCCSGYFDVIARAMLGTDTTATATSAAARTRAVTVKLLKQPAGPPWIAARRFACKPPLPFPVPPNFAGPGAPWAGAPSGASARPRLTNTDAAR